MPFWDPDYSDERKAAPIRICFTPSGNHERYPRSHKLYWHSKGANTTWRVLDSLRDRFGCEIETTRSGQVPHATSLAMKRRSHIVIDECVTGSYHRNSLDGLAAGCAVVNGVGPLPGVVEAMRRCAPTMQELPFVFADLESLDRVLIGLVEGGVARLLEIGRANRSWMDARWDLRRSGRTCGCPPSIAQWRRSQGCLRRCPRGGAGGHVASELPRHQRRAAHRSQCRDSAWRQRAAVALAGVSWKIWRELRK